MFGQRLDLRTLEVFSILKDSVEGDFLGYNRPEDKAHKLYRCFTDTWQLKGNLQMMPKPWIL